MTINDNDIAEIIKLLSKERLGTITKHAVSKNPIKVIEIHQEILSLGGNLMSIVGTIEIALRNTIYENLKQHFGVEDIFFHPPESFEWPEGAEKAINTAVYQAKEAKYLKMTRIEQKKFERAVYGGRRPKYIPYHDKIAKLFSHISVSVEDIIAHLTFLFWKKLYAPIYEKSLWKPTLRQTFSNREITRANVADNLDIIYKTRNRLAHHELVLRDQFYQTLRAIKFITQNLNQSAPNPNSPLAKLLANDIKKITAKATKLYASIPKKPA